MRTNWYFIARAIRAAKTRPLTTARALTLGKFRALRALYETSVYARFSFPGTEDEQRSLREATATCRELQRQGHDVRALRAQIKEARLVPLDLTSA